MSSYYEQAHTAALACDRAIEAARKAHGDARALYLDAAENYLRASIGYYHKAGQRWMTYEASDGAAAIARLRRSTP